MPDITIPGDAFPSGTTFDNDTTYWPVIRIHTNGFSLPNRGRGIIIADSNFTISGSNMWDGIVLVGGQLTSNGNNTTAGATLSGLNYLIGGTPSTSSVDDSQANGQKTYVYNSCNVDKATSHMKKYSVLPNTLGRQSGVVVVDRPATGDKKEDKRGGELGQSSPLRFSAAATAPRTDRPAARRSAGVGARQLTPLDPSREIRRRSRASARALRPSPAPPPARPPAQSSRDLELRHRAHLRRRVRVRGEPEQAIGQRALRGALQRGQLRARLRGPAPRRGDQLVDRLAPSVRAVPAPRDANSTSRAARSRWRMPSMIICESVRAAPSSSNDRRACASRTVPRSA